jgi:peptide/nickel transport system substrate-binding protein
VKGPSNIARIIHRYIPAASTRVAALEAGELHAADILPALDVNRLQQGGKFKGFIGVAAGLSNGALFNITRPPFSDKRVRMAFMHAIDRARLTQNLYFGLVKPAFGPLAPTTPAYWAGAESYYPFDRNKANALLEEAGWKMGPNNIRVKDGQPLKVFFPSLTNPDAAVALQGEAKRVGFDVQVEIVLKQRQDEILMNNQYEMAVLQWVSNSPGILRVPFHSSNVPVPGKFKFNWARVEDPALDAMIDKAAAARTPEERIKLYGELQKEIMDRAIYFPIQDQVQTAAASTKVQGLRFARGNWQIRFHEAKIVG